LFEKAVVKLITDLSEGAISRVSFKFKIEGQF